MKIHIVTYSGNTYQTLAYAPFGEILVNEFSGDYDEAYKFTGYERDQESGLDYMGARYNDPPLSIEISTDNKWYLFPHISPYNSMGNNPIKYIDPDGQAIRLANIESFNVLLSSLPIEARGMITMTDNFIDLNSVNAAYSQFGNSGNLQALRDIVADSRIVDFNATATSYDYVDSQTGKTLTENFQSPSRVNMYQELLSEFNGTPQDKQVYSQQLLQVGFVDEIEVSGNFGATLRPSNAQQPYPGGQISTTNNFQVYVNPVGTTPTEQAKNVGHELFGHLYFYFMGKDPRHISPTSNPPLNQQIIDRERESESNFNR
jgi:RHS repeat-associated protein